MVKCTSRRLLGIRSDGKWVIHVDLSSGKPGFQEGRSPGARRPRVPSGRVEPVPNLLGHEGRTENRGTVVTHWVLS